MQLFTSFVVVITHTLFQICLPSSSSFDSFILCVPPCLFPSLPIASPRFPSRPVVYVKFNLAVLTGVVAGVIVEWYWSSHDDDHAEGKKGCCCHKPHPDGHHPKMAPLPILRSFRNVVRYYLGSMAHGSFWIAFILFLRFVVAYIVSQTAELQKKNKILLYIGKCVMVSRGLGEGERRGHGRSGRCED